MFRTLALAAATFLAFPALGSAQQECSLGEEESFAISFTPRDIEVARAGATTLVAATTRRDIRILRDDGTEVSRIGFRSPRLIDFTPLGNGFLLVTYGAYAGCPNGSGRTCMRAFSLDREGVVVASQVENYGGGLNTWGPVHWPHVMTHNNRAFVRFWGATGGHSWWDQGWVLERDDSGAIRRVGDVIDLPSEGSGAAYCNTRIEHIAFDGESVAGIVRRDPQGSFDPELLREMQMPCPPAQAFFANVDGETEVFNTPAVSADVVAAELLPSGELAALVSRRRGRGVIVRIARDHERREELVAQGTQPLAPFDALGFAVEGEERSPLRVQLRTLTGVEQASAHRMRRISRHRDVFQEGGFATLATTRGRGRGRRIVLRELRCD